MKEEEKKAINNLKEFIKKQWIQLSNFCYGINKKTLGTMTDKEIYSIEIALNLIEKQQAEIEDWKRDYNHRCQLAIDRKIELEKKDKIINLMAEYFEGYEIDDVICLNNKEEVIEYFSKKSEKGE